MSFQMLPDREDGLDDSNGCQEPKPEKEINITPLAITLLIILFGLPLAGLLCRLVSYLFLFGWNLV